MPMQYKVLHKFGITLTQWSGTVDATDVQGYLESYQQDPDFRPQYTTLSDVSRVDGVDIDFQRAIGLLHFIENLPLKNAVLRTIIWAPSDVVFGVGRMFESMSDLRPGLAIEMYRDEREAIQATGLPFSSFSEISGQDD